MNVVNMKTRPVCVYGSDQIPENAVRSSLLSDCLACSISILPPGVGCPKTTWPWEFTPAFVILNMKF